MTDITKDTHQKALSINLDLSKYGTIAEIGAGQETARWFFQVGGAAGTIAKSMSAYDMKVSDAIYGTSPRYVSRDRLGSMLDREQSLLMERLDKARGKESIFFVFANTVAARSFTYKTDGHGWLGIRFQTGIQGEFSQIDVHVNLHGKTALRDQETLGVLGVNLIYGSMFLHHDPEALLVSLMDKLYPEFLEIDLVDFSGPAFSQVDNRIIALRLVQKEMSDAAMFTSDRNVALVSDTLWKKSVIIERSRFRPPTNFNINLLDCAQKEFIKETGSTQDEIIVLSEMTLRNLIDSESDEINVEDFLQRADILCALGKTVLISRYGAYYHLAQYLFRHTKKPIAIAMGLPTLREIFNEKYYEDLPGGILESFGRMFKHDLRLYVCPEIDPDRSDLIGVENLDVAHNLRHLYSHVLENGYVHSLDTVDKEYLKIFSHEVLEKIRNGDDEWESMVPEQVANIIKQQKLFKSDVGT